MGAVEKPRTAVAAPASWDYAPAPEARDIVSFGIVRDVEVGGFGTTITIAPPADSPDLVDQIGEQIAQVVAALPDAGDLTIVTAPPTQQKPPAQAPSTRHAQGIPGVKAIIAVASGK